MCDSSMDLAGHLTAQCPSDDQCVPVLFLPLCLLVIERLNEFRWIVILAHLTVFDTPKRNNNRLK